MPRRETQGHRARERRGALPRWTLPLGAVLWAAPAAANPFFVGRYGGLRGGPTDDGAFSVYWNPAGLGVEGGRVDLHVIGVHRDATYTREGADPTLPEAHRAVNEGEATTTSTGAVPALAARYGLRIGEALTLGAGAAGFVARAGRVSWAPDHAADERYPGAVDGPQRWAGIHTSLTLISVASGLGATYEPWGLSAGLAPAFTWASLDTLRARNADRSEALFDEAGVLKEGRILLEGAEDFGLNLHAGLAFQPSADLRFALSYIQGHTFTLEGPAYVTLGVAPETTARSRVPLPVPDTWRLAAEVGVSEWISVRPQLEWSSWSDMERQVVTNTDNGEPLLIIERDFDDTLAADLVVDLRLVRDLTMHLGGRYETGATPEHTFEPGLAEADSFWLSAGATWALGAHLELTACFYWHEFDDMNVRNSVQEPTTNGRYTDRRQYLTLDLGILL